MTFLVIFAANSLYLFVILAAVIAVGKMERGRRIQLLRIGIVSLPLTLIVARLAGYLYDDPRPFVLGNFTPLIAHAAENGFPSDHTLLTSAIAFLVLAFEKKMGLWLLLLSAIVGLARIASGVHHVIDVVGAIAISAAVLVAILSLRKKSAPSLLRRRLR
ncbi:phosphatase PAP2 family protein [Candidatus Peregrinibacteria bacterium]|nr:phosphatase PAP2 family protein [Candidatus Peregrinibacteria bacterium]MBI3816348.1 phosphatase PAP2 family protein [Candidatus Peregrinibacteria bacterium]